jgi:carboxynorspermidine decarboxylase
LEQFGKIEFTKSLLAELKTPCYLVNEARIEENLRTLKQVQDDAGCKILLAFKGFAMWNIAPLIMKYLPGVSASSVNEARMGREEFGGEVHVYLPAYSDADFKEVIKYANHIVFNSISQWRKYKDRIPLHIHAGLRINPEHREVKTELYDPCAPFSRLGITQKNFMVGVNEFKGITGLHFHNLCELNSDALEHTLIEVEKKFSFFFHQIQWINFGGGHHITRADYDRERLIRIIKQFKSRYNLEVYLEPGEAIALNTGVLMSTVLDVFNNGMDIAILDTSATAHMPDVLEMPYRPFILGAGQPDERAHTYRLGGLTCLAGDVIGDYSFDEPLKEGDKVIFGDMAHYTMVKNTTFNGVKLPSIYTCNSETGELKLVREFGYLEFKGRLS